MPRKKVIEPDVSLLERRIHIPSRTIMMCDLDEIDNIYFQEILSHVTTLEKLGTDPITIHMCSVGGDFFAGQAIFDAIVGCASPVRIVGWGAMWSMAAIIMQAADQRLLAPNTTVMVHDGSLRFSGSAGTVAGWTAMNTAKMTWMHNLLLGRMLERNPTVTLKGVEDLCARDTFMSAQDAVDCGLADGLLTTLGQLD